jgi:transcriptional regulator with XRE-family HTH domain
MKAKSNRIGRFFRQARIERGFSQEFVSKALGYDSPQMVSNWERGICSPPVSRLYDLVQLYGISRSKVIDIILQETRESLENQLSDRRRKKLA